MNITRNKYLFYTILNGVFSTLIVVILAYNFLNFKNKSIIYLTFIIALWIYFNLQNILLKETELSGDKK
jgi:hypothetical protein